MNRPGANRRSLKARLLGALILTFGFMALEIGGSFYSNSLALLADAAHMAVDAGALLLAFAAATLADRLPSEKYSFGLYRAEILAAFLNAQVLLLAAAYILYEGVRRLDEAPELGTRTMMLVAIGGLIANLASMRLLHVDKGNNLNTSAAYFEVLTDAMGSLGVLSAAVVIQYTGWQWIDAAVSIAIALVVAPRGISILRQATRILLEGSPREIEQGAVRRRLQGLDGVTEVHDLHLWSLTSGMNMATVHILIAPGRSPDQVQKGARQILKEEAKVTHATIQVETAGSDHCSPDSAHP